MPELSKDQRLARLSTALEAAVAAEARLRKLSNSGNPNVAADAEAFLIEARNVRDDLTVILALIGNKPANQLKPLDPARLAELGVLEAGIDERVRANQILTAGLTIVTQVVIAARSVGQILNETQIAPPAPTGAGSAIV